MLNLRNYRISSRLLATTLGALGLMVVFVAIALVNLSAINDNVEHIVQNNMHKTELAVDMRMRNLLIGRHIRTALLRDKVEQFQEEQKKVESDFAKYLESEKELDRTLVTDRGRKLFAEVLDTRRPAEESIKKTFQLLNEGNKVEAQKEFFDRTRPQFSSTSRCCANEGNAMSKGSASSVIPASPRLSRSMTARRVGSERAWKTRLICTDWLGICLTIDRRDT